VAGGFLRAADHLHAGPGHLGGQRLAAAYRRRPVRLHARSFLGADQLFGGRRHHAGGLQLAERLHRAQALHGPFGGPVHDFLRPLRHGPEPAAAYHSPHPAGHRRRRPSAAGAGRAPGKLPAGEARPGHGGLRDGDSRGADHRPHPRRLDHGQLFLALDLLHQRPDRRARPCPAEHVPRGPSLPEAGQVREDRLLRPGADGHRHRRFPARDRQRPGSGLVRRRLDPLRDFPRRGIPAAFRLVGTAIWPWAPCSPQCWAPC